MPQKNNIHSSSNPWYNISNSLVNLRKGTGGRRSSKSNRAFVDEDNVLVARNTGKTKLTAKINGKTLTIDVNVTE